jgi:hypothetical protein
VQIRRTFHRWKAVSVLAFDVPLFMLCIDWWRLSDFRKKGSSSHKFLAANPTNDLSEHARRSVRLALIVQCHWIYASSPGFPSSISVARQGIILPADSG